MLKLYLKNERLVKADPKNIMSYCFLIRKGAYQDCSRVKRLKTILEIDKSGDTLFRVTALTFTHFIFTIYPIQ